MNNYLQLAKRILDTGSRCNDRTGTGTTALFGPQLEFYLPHGLPLLTTKKVFTRGVVEELLWMLRGETNVRSLQERGVHIWDEWADDEGDLGKVYGHQWREFGVHFMGVGYGGEDQIKQLIDGMRSNPHGRRHIVSAWNPSDLEYMALPPCHCFFQFDLTGGQVNCKLYQRSADYFLGVPFNIASYAILTHLVAHCLDMPVGWFVHTFGNVHIYNNHRDQMFQQLERKPKLPPTLKITGSRREYPWQYNADQIHVKGYNPHPAIKGEVSV